MWNFAKNGCCIRGMSDTNTSSIVTNCVYLRFYFRIIHLRQMLSLRKKTKVSYPLLGIHTGRVKNINFSEKFAFISNGWPLAVPIDGINRIGKVAVTPFMESGVFKFYFRHQWYVGVNSVRSIWQNFKSAQFIPQ